MTKFLQVEETIRLQSLVDIRYMMQTSIVFIDPFLESPVQQHEEIRSLVTLVTGKEKFKFKVNGE